MRQAIDRWFRSRDGGLRAPKAYLVVLLALSLAVGIQQAETPRPVEAQATSSDATLSGFAVYTASSDQPGLGYVVPYGGAAYELTPAFTAGTYDYRVRVPEEVERKALEAEKPVFVTVVATSAATDVKSILVDGPGALNEVRLPKKEVASGEASGPWRAFVGYSLITVKVTSQDGNSVKSYRVIVERGSVDDPSGVALAAGDGSLTLTWGEGTGSNPPHGYWARWRKAGTTTWLNRATLSGWKTDYGDSAPSGTAADGQRVSGGSYVISGLDNGAEYEVQLRGARGGDTSYRVINWLKSEWVTVRGAPGQTQPQPPGPPACGCGLKLFADAVPAEGGGPVTVTAGLGSPAGAGGVTVTLTAGGTATSGDDYTLSSATISVAAGATAGASTITVIDDAVDDDGETIILSAAITGSSLSASPLTLTITDNDDPPAQALTITPVSPTREYGGTDDLSYTVGGLDTGDSAASVVSGSLSRAAGDDAGSYAFDLSGLSVASAYSGKYALPAAPTVSDYTITARPIASVSGVSVNSRPADDTTAATFDTSAAEGAGVLAAELADFRAGGLVVSGSFPAATVGTHSLSVTYSLQDQGSFKAANYSLSSTTDTLQGEITETNVTFETPTNTGKELLMPPCEPDPARKPAPEEGVIAFIVCEDHLTVESVSTASDITFYPEFSPDRHHYVVHVADSVTELKVIGDFSAGFPRFTDLHNPVTGYVPPGWAWAFADGQAVEDRDIKWRASGIVVANNGLYENPNAHHRFVNLSPGVTTIQIGGSQWFKHVGPSKSELESEEMPGGWEGRHKWPKESAKMARKTYTLRLVWKSPSTALQAPVEPAAPPKTHDYDTDDDGLIEISSLAQLDAMRWDVDGDGYSDHGGALHEGFPNPLERMGCPQSGCIGYELTADLDFDTNGNGRADAGDAYWNSGYGWLPIGIDTHAYGAVFEGNGHVIRNLYIDSTVSKQSIATDYVVRTARMYGLVHASVGMFETVAAGAVIRNLGLESVNVSRCLSQASASDCAGVYAGGLAGTNSGEISDSYVTGAVSNRHRAAGGLVGNNDSTGVIAGSYATASVTRTEEPASGYAGGLVGRNEGVIKASYATGAISGRAHSAGGLVGHNVSSGSITASYATGQASSSGRHVGGLVGLNDGSVTAAYSTGSVSGGSDVGGLVGSHDSSGAVTAAYWDTVSSGYATSAAGSGKTTAELWTPAGYTGIYANWNLDLDGDGSADDPWDFGTSCQYPVLKYGGLNPDDQRTACNGIFLEATVDVKVETTDDIKIQRLILPQGITIEPAFRPDHYDYRVIVPSDMEMLDVDGWFSTPWDGWYAVGEFGSTIPLRAYIVVSEDLSETEVVWDDRSLGRDGQGPWRGMTSYPYLLATSEYGSLKEIHRKYYPSSFRTGEFDLTQGEAATVQIGLYKWKHSRAYRKPFAETSIKQVYTLTVNRGLPSADNADLHDLTISEGSLSFQRTTTSYAVDVPVAVDSVTLTPTTNHPEATVTVNGADPATAVTLALGANAVNVVVTAADGITTKTYTVTVTRTSQSNRAPTVSAAIADATIVSESGTHEVSLSGVFADADSDSLTITASSSDETKATVSVASNSSSLTVSAQMRGAATITVTANDGNGGTVEDAFIVTVKAAPAVASAISDVSGLEVDGTQDIFLSGVFSDADGDVLTVTATSSNDAVATVSVASDGSKLTLAGVAEGTATITVTAEDSDGNTVSDDFEVPVAKKYTALIAQMYEWRNDPQWSSFKDHTDRWDRALLAFGETVADTTLTRMTAAEAQALADQGSAWSRWVDVAAALQEIESSGQQQNTPANRAPTVYAAIADATIVNESGTRQVSLSGVFEDGDGDSLTITASSDDTTVATVSVSAGGSSLTVTARSRGTATITVSADDGNGGSVSDAFTVTVKAAPTVASAISDITGLEAGSTQDVSLSGVFSDADGDALTVTATSSDETKATVSVASDSSSLTVSAVSAGDASINVIAQDSDGNRVFTEFGVAVTAVQQDTQPQGNSEPNNQEPVDTSSSEPDPTATETETGTSDIVARYDANGDGKISNSEMSVALNDYYRARITNSQMLEVLAAR